MSTIKTAISMEQQLFRQMEAVAQDMHISRSRLLSLAVQQFLKQRENEILLSQLNSAYQEGPTQEEQENIIRMSHLQKELLDTW